MKAVQHWWQRRAHQRAAPLARRWVVIDTETSGLNPARDRLIALAAVAVHLQDDRPVLRAADHLDLLLQAPPGLQLDEVARRNILLHGVGRGAQGALGLPAEQGLQALLDFCDGAPCIAFHAGFDADMLDRASQRLLGRPWPLPWLDLAVLARALHPELPHRTLDAWLAHFGLQVAQRHRAIADAWATAELLQCLWPAWRGASPQGDAWTQAQDWIAARRWVGG